jgi:hypothetical protein
MSDVKRLIKTGWYSDGQWHAAQEHYPVINPATGRGGGAGRDGGLTGNRKGD